MTTRWVRAALVAISMICVCRAQGDEERNWEEEFNKVYRLSEKEVLKRIEPPFIPQRLDYYQQKHSSQAQSIAKPPTYFNFQWRNEKLVDFGLGFLGDGALGLSGMLHNILQMPLYEFEGDKELLEMKLPGDWIVRPDAPVEQKLQAAGDILHEATGKNITFTQQELPRNVIVVTGNYSAETRDSDGRIIDIHCYSGQKDPTEGGGGGSGTLEEFMTRLGDLAGSAVAIETPSRPIGTISWRTHRSSYLDREPPGTERDEKINQLLQNVAQQTGLEFKVEERKVPVWVAKEDGQ